MNFLAHLFLSGDQEEVMIGNFLGDFVKGTQINEYPDRIQTGIGLHRNIDRFTDTHTVVRESKVRLRKKFRHYAPVIVDIFYDHFLAKDWAVFSAVPLKEYTEKFYITIQNYFHILPENVIYILKLMTQDNWLYNYQFMEGIDRTLKGMSKRTKFESKMEEAIVDLKQDYELYRKEFHAFFPELRTYVTSMIQ